MAEKTVRRIIWRTPLSLASTATYLITLPNKKVALLQGEPRDAADHSTWTLQTDWQTDGRLSVA